MECETAGAINDAAAPLPGLGASDCDCETHLAYGRQREPLERVVADCHVRQF